MRDTELLSEQFVRIENDVYGAVDHGESERALAFLNGKDYQLIKSNIMLPITSAAHRMARLTAAQQPDRAVHNHPHSHRIIDSDIFALKPSSGFFFGRHKLELDGEGNESRSS